MAAIESFKIDIPTEKLDRLRQKLLLANLPDELDDVEWDRGSPLADIKRLVDYWVNGYDWLKAQERLNKMPQYVTEISIEGFETLRIHFVHKKSEVANAIPLLFAHGWPGSFDEVSKILPELVVGGKDFPAFHVIAPSLPNFGFSQGTKKKGFTSKHHAQVCQKLMVALGYEQYGGDIGVRHFRFSRMSQIREIRAVTRGLGLQYPQSCRASHLNFTIPNPPNIVNHPELFFKVHQAGLDASEKAGVERTKWFRQEGYGYNLEQSTKPQTIGYSMADSPVGLLGWIYAGPAASQRIYYESTHDPEEFSRQLTGYIPDVKLGVARFPKEILIMPRLWVHTMGEVVYESEYESGGHFAAWERPDAIVKDLREMFGKSGGAYGCIQGRSGFE